MLHIHTTRNRLSVVFLAAALAACGGGGDAGGDTGGAPAGGGETAAPAAVENAGTISGVINFAGSPPAPAPIDMAAEPDCAAKHSTPPMSMEVVASDGKLANVFIYIKEGLTGTHAASGASPEINQDGCEYIPHVVGVQTGQQVTIRNSDGLLHNIKAQPTNNRPFNISQPTNMTSNQTFSQPEVMVPVQCDVHGWMNMYIGVTDHPYFAVSAADGTFTIANVPPGTYTIEAWHEKYGVMTQQVTVEPNGASTATFEYNASMAGAFVPLGEPIDPHGSHNGAAHAHAGAGGE
jgi:plastocyanin